MQGNNWVVVASASIPSSNHSTHECLPTTLEHRSHKDRCPSSTFTHYLTILVLRMLLSHQWSETVDEALQNVPPFICTCLTERGFTLRIDDGFAVLPKAQF